MIHHHDVVDRAYCMPRTASFVLQTRLRDEGEDVALAVTEFVVAAPRPVGRRDEDCGPYGDRSSVMKVNIADAYHD